MASRIDRLGAWFSPPVRLLWGSILMPLLIFQPHWSHHLVLTVLFGVLAAMAGKRVNLAYFAFLAGSIAFFNLLTPMGKVLWRLGPFVLTQGALDEGLSKGLGIVGLVFISLFSVSRNLRLPGHLGGLLARMFFYYQKLLEERKSLRLGALVMSVDRLLERIYRPGESPDAGPDSPPPEVKNAGFGAFLAVSTWFFAGFLLFWR